MAVRVPVRVTPRSRRPGIGPVSDGVLAVRVAAPPVEGAATEAALAAVADALGVRRRNVRLVTGATARAKVVEVDAPGVDLAARLEELGFGRAPSRPPR